MVAKTEREIVEETPAFEIHLGEPSLVSTHSRYRRLVIIWLNGKRWEGHIWETPEGEKSDVPN